MNNTKTLITGATGKTGSRILQKLEALGQDVRPGSRKAAIPFDWDDQATWAAALDGIDAAYLCFYPDLAIPGAPEIIQAFTDQAVAAGVKKLVLISGRGEHHAELCEQVVLNSGAEATVLRASWFMQNFDEGEFLESVRSGRFAFPAGDVLEPFLDIEDLADVAVAAFTEEGHAGRIYELTGPDLLHFSEVATMLSEACGHEVRYEAITLEENLAMMTEMVDADFAHFLTELLREVMDGRNAHLGNGVQEALGREPRSFQDFCARVAATGIWQRSAETAAQA